MEWWSLLVGDTLPIPPSSSFPRVCRVIVGAPRANSTYSSSVHSPGTVYKCRVHNNPERRCTEMDLGRGQWPQSHSITTAATLAFRGSQKFREQLLPRKLPPFCFCSSSCPLSPSANTLPQASVLFYQNNAALCLSLTVPQLFFYLYCRVTGTWKVQAGPLCWGA